MDNSRKDTVMAGKNQQLEHIKQQNQRQIQAFVREKQEKSLKPSRNAKKNRVFQEGKRMFDKFGEMNSYEEINELAENLFNEGDFDSLRKMAKENGIEADFVEMYIAGQAPYLSTSV